MKNLGIYEIANDVIINADNFGVGRITALKQEFYNYDIALSMSDILDLLENFENTIAKKQTGV